VRPTRSNPGGLEGRLGPRQLKRLPWWKDWEAYY